MNLTKKIWYVLIFFSILTGSEKLLSQPAGGPIFTTSDNEFTVSVDGGFFTKKIFGTKNDSRRFFLKSAFGITDRVDFFGLFGFVNMGLVLSDSARTVLNDGYNIAYGAGLTIQLVKLEKLRASFFLSGNALRFVSEPTNEKPLSFGGTPATQVLALKYDWREFNISSGLAKQIGALVFYGGVNGKIIQRFETKTEKLVFSGQSNVGNIEKGKYTSGLLLSSMAGIDLHLPSNLRMSFELIARSETDFAFYFGLSQTGKP